MADRRDRVGSRLSHGRGLNEAGYEVTGLDISAEAVANARSRFGPQYERQDIFKPDDAFVGAFDFAVVLETVEHVPDPTAFLGAVTRLLKPSGSLLVTTPNRCSHPHGARWRTDLPPVHLFWLTEDAVIKLASEIGYRVELIDFSEFNVDHRQTVALGDLDASPPPMLSPAMEPYKAIPFRTRFMERLREVPSLAGVSRLLYDGARPGSNASTNRSFSPRSSRR